MPSRCPVQSRRPFPHRTSLGVLLLGVLGVWVRAAAGGASEEPSRAAPVLLAASAPSLELTFVPPVGSSEVLRGRALNAASSAYRVAVYINVFGWWTKPSWTAPTTSLQRDGTWACNIATGGNDVCATQIAAFLVPATYAPPLLGGESQLPAELEQKAVAKTLTDRVPLARSVSFSGREWAVKSTAQCQWGPGPNYYSDSTNNVWVDALDQLHLRITHRDGRWQCAEVVLRQSLGYGTYRFTLGSPVDQLDRHVVAGAFTWSDDPAFHHREIDIEFSKWSDPNNPNNAQFVVQPFDQPQQLLAFRQPASLPVSNHRFAWEPGQVFFQSVRGTNQTPSDNTRLIRQWNFTKATAIPPPGDEATHINLWLFNSQPPANGQEVEVIFSKFEFTPAPPPLSVSQQPDGILIGWPAGYSGYTAELAPGVDGPWKGGSIQPGLTNGRYSALLLPREPIQFFRLRK